MAETAKVPTVYERMREIGFRLKKPVPGTFGFEIETEVSKRGDYPEGFLPDGLGETISRGDIAIPGWEVHTDNSLRNYGIEYVFKKPLDFDEGLLAIKRFAEGTKEIPFIKDAPATSVHVHVNMMNESVLTMMNFIALYTLFENVLVDYSGESRRSNLFSLPMRVAGQTHEYLLRLIEMFNTGDSSVAQFHPNYLKYAALNIAPLNTQGSLEIRTFRGETDEEELKNWLTIIQRLLEYARTPGLTPRIILFEYRLRGIEYVNVVFKEMAEILRSKVNDTAELIDKNLWLLFRIATEVTDWESLDQVQKVKETPAVYDELNLITPWTTTYVGTEYDSDFTPIVDDIDED